MHTSEGRSADVGNCTSSITRSNTIPLVGFCREGGNLYLDATGGHGTGRDGRRRVINPVTFHSPQKRDELRELAHGATPEADISK